MNTDFFLWFWSHQEEAHLRSMITTYKTLVLMMLDSELRRACFANRNNIFFTEKLPGKQREIAVVKLFLNDCSY